MCYTSHDQVNIPSTRVLKAHKKNFVPLQIRDWHIARGFATLSFGIELLPRRMIVFFFFRTEINALSNNKLSAVHQGLKAQVQLEEEEAAELALLL